jgi:hypothetical protein
MGRADAPTWADLTLACGLCCALPLCVVFEVRSGWSPWRRLRTREVRFVLVGQRLSVRSDFGIDIRPRDAAGHAVEAAGCSHSTSRFRVEVRTRWPSECTGQGDRVPRRRARIACVCSGSGSPRPDDCLSVDRWDGNVAACVGVVAVDVDDEVRCRVGCDAEVVVLVQLNCCCVGDGLAFDEVEV